MLVSNLALGVQACYRGPRLFDTAETKAVVEKWVAWFRQYRDILESDLIHGRRADGRDLDWMLHVNPRLDPCGMLVVFNPLDRSVSRTIDVSFYYAGLSDAALVCDGSGPPIRYELNRAYRASIPVTVPPRGVKWYPIHYP
jgi:hypothetical protein